MALFVTRPSKHNWTPRIFVTPLRFQSSWCDTKRLSGNSNWQLTDQRIITRIVTVMTQSSRRLAIPLLMNFMMWMVVKTTMNELNNVFNNYFILIRSILKFRLISQVKKRAFPSLCSPVLSFPLHLFAASYLQLWVEEAHRLSFLLLIGTGYIPSSSSWSSSALLCPGVSSGMEAIRTGEVVESMPLSQHLIHEDKPWPS